MSKTQKDIIIISFSTLLITFLVWLPHILGIINFYGLNFSDGFNTIYRNFDGIEYIIIAKSLYDPQIIASLPQSLATNYYAAHFPLYSLLILLFSPLLGFLKSMLFVTLFSTIGSTIAFYFLVKNFKLSAQPLFLSLLFLILPARWLIVHSVGSSEPTFILFVILSIYFFMKFEQISFTHLKLKDPLPKKTSYIYLSGFFGLLALLTRPPGVLLGISFALFILWKTWQEKISINSITNQIKSYYPLLLIPFGLILIFTWYHFTYNDFFAYFHSGDNIHLTFPPFQVFNISQPWVGDIWLEDIIYIYIFGFLGSITLLKQKLYPIGFFVLTFFLASIFVAHRDISRYTLPAFPFILIAFEKFLTSKEFKIVLAILALGIYLYSQNYIIQNTAPIPNLNLFN